MAKSFRNCEIEYQLQRFPELDKVKVKSICDGLLRKGNITNYAFIEHNKCISDDGTPKAPHIHVELERKDKNPARAEQIANWFGVQEQNVQTIKGHFEDAVAYLTHENKPEKTQYSRDEVISSFSRQKLDDVINGVLEAKKRKSFDLEDFIRRIGIGEVTTDNMWKHIDFNNYTKYDRRIDKAFATYNKIRNKEMKGSRDMKVFYFTGASGTGKTTYAKKFAESLGMSCYPTGTGKNPFDDYDNEECIILDEVRGGNWSIADLCQILDNNNAGMAGCRYHNKYMWNVKMIIMTSTSSLYQLIQDCDKAGYDPREQIERRITAYWVFHKSPDVINMYSYQAGALFDRNKDIEGCENFAYSGTVENPVPKMYPEKSAKSVNDDYVAKLGLKPVSRDSFLNSENKSHSAYYPIDDGKDDNVPF